MALALALASGTAAALGLGQIEVKSRLGQPFLAEIPIISSDPSELESLQAELASPITFARIGLQPPAGVVADLQFASALDAAGRPIIRVTSEQPVNEPLLTFLVSVDWGQGRLVREYSALLDTPRTVQAPLQPAIDETVVSAPNVIERPAEPVATTEPAPEPAPADEQVAGQPDAANPDAIAPMPEAVPPPQQASVPQAVAVAPAPVEASAGSDIHVRRGDTLSQIAGRVEAASLDQAMIALLRANPDAFIGGNINRLKAGAVLRVPDGADMAAVDTAQASRIVASQVRQWRDASRAAVAQPSADSGVVAGALADNAGANPSTNNGAARTSDARLEIVPPGASNATQAGTQSGINAGGEGDMLRQEQVQTQETLAAREAEVQELKGRIAELEQLQQKQQQLMAMKDSELAAAQQRLAKSNQEQAAGGPSYLPWIIGGGALVLALIGGLLLRRRPAKAVFRAPAVAAPVSEQFAQTIDDTVDDEPAFVLEQPVAPAEPARPAPPVAPAWHVAAADNGGGRGKVEPTLATQPGQERLELARAYLDLGDHDSARQLLSEVVINGDLAARQQASRMLQELE